MKWKIFEDVQSVAQAACQHILKLAEETLVKQSTFRIVLAGGQTPQFTYRLLRAAKSDWKRWHIYYGDERCLPEENSERNSTMVVQAWLTGLPIVHHPIPAHWGPQKAAQHYAHVIKNILPFDLVLLGMGEDGHTASLFPGQVYPSEELVHALNNAPKPPPDRVTLSVKALSSTQHLIFLVTGASKREALSKWLQGGDLPVAQIRSQEEAIVFIDQAAYRETLNRSD